MLARILTYVRGPTAVLSSHEPIITRARIPCMRQALLWHGPTGRLFIGCDTGEIKVVLISPTLEIARTLNKHTRAVSAFTLIPNMRLLVSGGKDARILLWDTNSLRPRCAMRCCGGGGAVRARARNTVAAVRASAADT